MILLVVAVGALAQCGLGAPLDLRGYLTHTFVGFTLKQRIAFRIGQVECLKTLLSEDEFRRAQFGLGTLHLGNYSRDITRFDLKQRIAFLFGQVQCLKIYANLDRNNESSPVEGIIIIKLPVIMIINNFILINKSCMLLLHVYRHSKYNNH